VGPGTSLGKGVSQAHNVLFGGCATPCKVKQAVDRRFYLWLISSTLLVFLWISLRPTIPEREPPAADLALPAPGEQADRRPVADVDASMEAADAEPEASRTEAAILDEAPSTTAPVDRLAAPRPALIPEQRLVLGSQNPQDNYRLMVILNNRGACIERVELVEQSRPGAFRYRQLNQPGSAIGYLGLTGQSAGLRVGCVPPGSAAAVAEGPQGERLQAGDLLLEADQRPLRRPDDLLELLRQRRPGSQLTMQVAPGGELDAAYPLTLTTTHAPLDILRLEDPSRDEIAFNFDRGSLLTTLAQLDNLSIVPGRRLLEGLEETLDGCWESEPIGGLESGMGFEFRLPLTYWLSQIGIEAELELFKRYVLRPADPQATQPTDELGYHLELQTGIRNLGPRSHRVALRQEGLNGLTLEGWWYSSKLSPHMFDAAGARDVVYNSQSLKHQLVTTRTIAKYAADNSRMPDKSLFSGSEPEAQRSLRYMGIDAQYFAACVLPHPDQPESLTNLQQAATVALGDVQRIPNAQRMATNTSFWFDTSLESLPAGSVDSPSELVRKYQVFVGPKDHRIVDHYGLDGLIEYGWFGLIAKPLEVVLHTFYFFVRNYGLAIIMLTLLVRGCMFPLGRRAALNAQRMQELAPELKRIAELHKDDLQKRTAATQELYRQHNFRPLAGCLPLFIQLPIFIGLYRCFAVDIELRQQPLIPGLTWCQNLAAPDMLLDWSSWMPDIIAGRGLGYLGPYFNILPLVTVSLFLVQQRIMMPKATDEQTRMTQQVMTVMTMVMGIMFFRVSAGLCVYFVTSSIWSLIERRLVKRLAGQKPSIAIRSAGSAAAVATPTPTMTNEQWAASRTANKAGSSTRPAAVKGTGSRPKGPPPPPEKLSEVLPWLKKQATDAAARRSASPEPPRPGRTGKPRRPKPPKP
jgi:YidC/Oxa1 family membrane protein insertase